MAGMVTVLTCGAAWEAVGDGVGVPGEGWANTGVISEKAEVFLATLVRAAKVCRTALTAESGVGVAVTAGKVGVGNTDRIIAQASRGSIKMLNTLRDVVVLELNIRVISIEAMPQKVVIRWQVMNLRRLDMIAPINKLLQMLKVSQVLKTPRCLFVAF
jgi:hypothetical protein